MAEKLLKTKKRKIAAKKCTANGGANAATNGGANAATNGGADGVAGRAVSTKPPQEIALVATYREKQLAWIKKNGVYNYPVKEGDEFDAAAFGRIKELWLYAGSKGKRHCFAAEFVGKMTRDEFLASYPTYANLGRAVSMKPPRDPNGRAVSTKPPKDDSAAKDKISLLGKSENREYYVFKTSFLDYGPKLDNPQVVIRAMDFATGRGRARLVKKAFDQFKTDGEFTPLAAYLPSALSAIPRQQLRVCEAAVQMEFFQLVGGCYDNPVPFPALEHPNFTFIDLFAGIGGFHLAMHRLGGKCVFASEWDKAAQGTYAQNYGIMPKGDITKIGVNEVPDHDVLCAGFPCQPFSKAGKQQGFDDETKGTLFFDIERILRSKIDNGHPTRYIVLENVRNLVSHDSGKTWNTISSHLKNLGYRLTSEPLIVSPHYFGIPQLRERVLILGVYEPHNVDKPLIVELPQFMRKEDCDVHEILEDGEVAQEYYLNNQEIAEIEMWDEFYRGIKETVLGFPVWAEYFSVPPDDEMPEWKQEFVRKNNALYRNNKRFIDGWLRRHNNLEDVTPTMRKLEWQVGDNAESLWDCLMQKRPSGLRVKRIDCAPALVAIVQVPIIGPRRRRMTVREAARLQSFPDDFIPNPVMHEAYKQFGNAVNVEVVRACSASLFRHGEQTIIFE